MLKVRYFRMIAEDPGWEEVNLPISDKRTAQTVYDALKLAGVHVRLFDGKGKEIRPWKRNQSSVSESVDYSSAWDHSAQWKKQFNTLAGRIFRYLVSFVVATAIVGYFRLHIKLVALLTQLLSIVSP